MSKDVNNATLSFVVETETGQISSQEVYSPITGLIRKITITFPRNANFGLGAKFTLGTVTIIPTPARGANEYIRLDNFTETIYPEYPIKAGDIISLRTTNNIVGETDLKTISALVHIQR